LSFILNYLTNFRITAITNAKIPNASANAIAKIIVVLISPAALGFLPIAFIAERPISQIARAGPKAHIPKANATAYSIHIFIKIKK
jgi:hypothetical protein